MPRPPRPTGLSPTHAAATTTGWPQGSPVVLAPPNELQEDGWHKLLDTVSRRRRIAGCTAATVMLATVLITAWDRIFNPIYEAGFTLLISDPIAQEGSGGGAESLALVSAISNTALNRTKVDLPTLIELLKSPLLLDPVAKRHNLDSAGLARNITIKPGGDRQREAEGVIRVFVKGPDRQRGSALVTDLSQAYLEASLRQRQERLNEGIRFLDQQAPALMGQTEALQQQLADFRRRNQVLLPLVEAGSLKEQSLTRQTSIASLESDRSRLLKARAAILNGSLTARSFQEAIGGSGGGFGGTGGGGGLEVTGMRQSQLLELAKLDEELAEARSRYTPNSSVVRSLQARRNQLAPNLRKDQLEAVDAALALNATRLSASRRESDQLNAQLRDQPALIKQYESLEQKLKLAQENLASFVQAREQFKLEAAQRTVPWKLIDPPKMNPHPVEPSIPGNLAKGLLLALAAGTGAALLRDRFDPVFHRSEEVREALQQPILGHVPHVKLFQGVREEQRFLLDELNGKSLPGSASTGTEAQKLERFFYQEAFRNLYTSLRFLNSDRPLRSVVLTSTIPAEGKSLVNVLLAKTLAEMGKRVLLVDADLRKPQVHVRLGLNNLVGFSNLLTETDLRVEEAIQSMPGYPGWQVITAGRIPPDPTRLLSSERIDQLVHQLENSDQFDLILYDTPPVLGLADAALMAQHCDGLVLLVSLGKVSRNLPSEAIQRVQSGGAQTLGVVTNAVKQEQSTPGSYAYANTAYAYYANAESFGQPATTAKTTLKERIGGALRWIDG
ncbi:MAG: polysaccharide biosynthesis tyrosine autokinase [Synechococcaceae cyanobacterium]|nr:polysaccharide biosynthesis tyrosine autokinase [Synechococcaceae cyanobacterium]